jgi:HAD superfamily hydrolase (TIGR01509 family)
MGLGAIIFDFNGVLVNDEPLHFVLFQRVLAEEGVPLTREEYYARYLPFPDRDLFQAVMRAKGMAFSPAQIEGMVERKGRYYADHADGVLFFPGAREFVLEASRRYPLAVASGARREEIETALLRAGLLDSFQAVVGAEDVARGKPDPEAFHLALQRINGLLGSGIMPEECLVVEDSKGGIEAAHRAGMKCLAVANSYPLGELKDADWAAEGLGDISLGRLEKAWGP